MLGIIVWGFLICLIASYMMPAWILPTFAIISFVLLNIPKRKHRKH